jgi:hypothetical protein
MDLTEREKALIVSLIKDGHGQWLADHYKSLGWNLADLESHVYAHVPEENWVEGFIVCLARYIMAMSATADGLVRGCANDNSWFQSYYHLPAAWARCFPAPMRLPKLEYNPFKRISRFRQWQSEDEFRALLPEPYQLPQRASESDKD